MRTAPWSVPRRRLSSGHASTSKVSQLGGQLVGLQRTDASKDGQCLRKGGSSLGLPVDEKASAKASEGAPLLQGATRRAAGVQGIAEMAGRGEAVAAMED